MNDPEKAELKKEKKIKKLLKKSAWAIGAGIGMILLKTLVAPFLGDNEEAEKALGVLGWCLAAYGTSTILSFIFLRNFIFKIDFIMAWAVMPLIFIKLFMDVF